MATIHASYEGGVFRPHGTVNLPDPCEVEFDPKIIRKTASEGRLDRIYDTLGERYQSGEADVAARHNEHQPDSR